MKSSIPATVEIKKNNGRDSFDAEIIFSLANVHEVKPLEAIGREVIPAVAEL